jgi:CubicO group peptidase (beta-lactamase class C family)
MSKQVLPVASVVLVSLLGCSAASHSVPPSGPTTALPATSAGSATPASQPKPVAAPPQPGAQLAAEQKIEMSSKASFTAPTGWFLGRPNELPVRVWGPERDLMVTIVDVGAAKDSAAAVAAAWAVAQPGFALAIAEATDLPGRDGWDAMAQVTYVTPTAESRLVIAAARKRGDHWFVHLIEGSTAAVGRRGAQLRSVVDSFELPGMVKESFAGKTAKLNADTLKQFAAFVEQARTLTHVPGVAVAVVHGGKIVFEQGFGVRKAGQLGAVTPQTKFMIGSTTKSLTTLMMARLVDAKKFDWATPVTTLMPTFALGDAATTKQVTMQHTVCACTGMPRRDLEFIFEFDKVTAEARIASMQTMQPTTAFGETFQYSNLMVAAGGYVAAHSAFLNKPLDAAYDAAMNREVVGPLKMIDTTFDMKRGASGNFAMPHGQGLSETMAYEPIAVTTEGAVSAVRPAGGAWSTVRDLARYVEMELAQGVVDGKTYVSKENLLKRRTPQIRITPVATYGLGLFVTNENDLPMLGHGGNTIGFTSDLFMFPEQDIGVVVLSNAGQANDFRTAVQRRFIELMFDGKPEALETLTGAVARDIKSVKESKALFAAVPNEAWMKSLLGTYQNASLGTIEVKAQGKGFILDAGEWQAAVGEMHDRDGTVKLVTMGVPIVGLELVPSAPGKPATLSLDAGQQVYVFAKK